jgi:hypothetical protein
VEVKQPEVASSIIEGLIELRKTGAVEDFIRGSWDANREAYAKLVQFDEGKVENWPGFEAFYTGLKTTLTRDNVRAEMRISARRRMQDEQKKELVYDLEVDDVLQRGVLELLKKLQLDPATIADYKLLPEKFKKKDSEQEGAMLPPNTNGVPK